MLKNKIKTLVPGLKYPEMQCWMVDLDYAIMLMGRLCHFVLVRKSSQDYSYHKVACITLASVT